MWFTVGISKTKFLTLQQCNILDYMHKVSIVLHAALEQQQLDRVVNIFLQSFNGLMGM